MRARTLLLPWAIALAVRLFVGYTAEAPTVLSDEVDYFLAARRPDGHQGVLSTRYPPFYPLFLSPLAGIGSRETGFFLSKGLNAMVSSLIVPLTWPIWASAGPIPGLVLGLLAPGVITSALLLSENLFAPLVALWLLAAAFWKKSPSMTSALFFSLSAAAATLTRAAGGALVITVLIMGGFSLRRHNRTAILALLLFSVLPILVFMTIDASSPKDAEPFNDPLYSNHPSEMTRGFVASVGDLTQDTILEPLAADFPFPLVFTCLWFFYWTVQYLLYLLVGTAFLPLAFLARKIRENAGKQGFLFPLFLATVILLFLSANHNLAGRQADQFVRGRYLEPLIPVWTALSIAAILESGSIRLSWWLLPVFATLGVRGLTASQNRSADLLHPLRSLQLSLEPGLRFWLSPIAGAVVFMAARSWLKLARRRTWLIAGLLLFVALGGVASVLRFEKQVEVAKGDAVIAKWLAENDETAGIVVDIGNAQMDSLKATGLVWAVQQIRFFSSNPLELADRRKTTSYVLHLGQRDDGVICSSHEAWNREFRICLSRRAED